MADLKPVSLFVIAYAGTTLQHVVSVPGSDKTLCGQAISIGNGWVSGGGRFFIYASDTAETRTDPDVFCQRCFDEAAKLIRQQKS
jgi:hypothetical protein